MRVFFLYEIPFRARMIVYVYDLLFVRTVEKYPCYVCLVNFNKWVYCLEVNWNWSYRASRNIVFVTRGENYETPQTRASRQLFNKSSTSSEQYIRFSQYLSDKIWKYLE